MIAIIPDEWKEVVCSCPRAFFDDTQLGYPKRVFRDEDTRLFTCVQCTKPSSHCLYTCIGCSSVFLKDFGHPLWQLDWPHCWSCLEQDKSRAAEVLAGLSSHKSRRVLPVLRFRYINITEGFDADNFSFDFTF
jgi:hypothetical protein